MQDSTLPKQSNSAIKRQARIDNAQMKQFGGKLDNFDDNRDRHFNQRMLKAYLKGATSFPFGFESVRNIRTGDFDPIYHDVLLTDKTVDANKLDALLAGGYNDPGKVFGGTSKNKGQLRKTVRKREKERVKAMQKAKGMKHPDKLPKGL